MIRDRMAIDLVLIMVFRDQMTIDLVCFSDLIFFLKIFRRVHCIGSFENSCEF